MGEYKHLVDEQAIEKIKEMAEDSVCLFCTYENNKIVSRPMNTRGIDDDGTLWFISRRDSEKNRQINDGSEVCLMYMHSGKQHYLTLTGSAQVIVDRQKTEELWSPFIKAWFEEGKDDPDLTLIRVTPEEGHYWDTKTGKLVYLLKVAVAAITGKEGYDGTLEGDIKV
jgi:general stress protein 26